MNIYLHTVFSNIKLRCPQRQKCETYQNDVVGFEERVSVRLKHWIAISYFIHLLFKQIYLFLFLCSLYYYVNAYFFLDLFLTVRQLLVISLEILWSSKEAEKYGFFFILFWVYTNFVKSNHFGSFVFGRGLFLEAKPVGFFYTYILYNCVLR